MIITKHNGGEVAIYIIAVAMPAGQHSTNADEIGALLTEAGMFNEESGIIDWQFIQPEYSMATIFSDWLTTTVPDMEVDEGEILNIKPIERLIECCKEIAKEATND